jgi:hypothetical protein
MAHRRLRARVNWAMRWGGLLACLVLAGLYIGNLWWTGRVAMQRETWTAELYWGDGALQVQYGRGSGMVPRAECRLFNRGPYRLPWVWGFHRYLVFGLFAHMSGPLDGLGWQRTRLVPIWLPLSAGLVCTAFAWRFAPGRSAIAGACPSCHYDRSGLSPDSPCPECATVPRR